MLCRMLLENQAMTNFHYDVSFHSCCEVVNVVIKIDINRRIGVTRHAEKLTNSLNLSQLNKCLNIKVVHIWWHVHEVEKLRERSVLPI